MFHFLISCVLLSAIGVLVKSLQGAASPLFILGLRSLFHLLTVLPRGRLRLASVVRDRDLVLRALTAFFGMVLYFYSLQRNPLIVATAFFWISPLFNLHLQGKRQRVLDWLPAGLVIGFVYLNPDLLGHLNWSGLAIGLMSSFCIGASYHYLGRAGSRHPAIVVEGAFAAMMSLLALPGLILTRPTLSMVTQPAFVVTLLGIAVAATFYQSSIVKVYRQFSPEKSAFAQAVGIPILSVAGDRWLFGAHYTGSSCALLIGGLLLTLILRLPQNRAVLTLFYRHPLRIPRGPESLPHRLRSKV